MDAGIEPYVTLYHWDLPQALEDKGGWPARMIVDAFLEYTEVISRALGDRVKNWITFNEPWVSAFVGYREGRHAPGVKDINAAVAASHHLLLSHGLAVPIIRKNSPNSEVGITLNMSPQVPASKSIADRDAVVWWDGFINRWFLDPLVGRGYPQDIVAGFGSSMEFVQGGDLEKIAVPLDFLGINYYSRGIVRSSKISEEENEPRTLLPNDEHTEMGWEVHPEALYDILGRLHFDYAIPAIYITENGAAYQDEVSSEGQVVDPARLNYIKRHLQQVHRAIGMDVPVRGYFVWSLLDNFEWALGYSKRFGLIYVDFETLQRIPKASAKWYAQVIRDNAVS